MDSFPSSSSSSSSLVPPVVVAPSVPTSTAAYSVSSDAYLYSLILRQLVDDGLTDIAQSIQQKRHFHEKIDEKLAHRKLAQIVKEHALSQHFSSHHDGDPEDIDRTSDELDSSDNLSNTTMKDSSDASSSTANPLSSSSSSSSLTNPIVSAQSLHFPSYSVRFVGQHREAVRCGAFSLDGHYMATGSIDSSIKLFDLRKIKTHSNKDEETHSHSSSSISHASMPLLRTYTDHERDIYALQFHPKEQFLFSASKDCSIRVFDYTKANMQKAWRVIRENSPVHTLAIHSSGEHMLVGTRHAMPRIYDLATFQSFISLDLKNYHQEGGVTSVVWHPRSSTWASGSVDGTVKIWDTVSNQCISTIDRAHSGAPVSSVQYSPNGKYLLTNGLDDTARLWDLSMLNSGVHNNTPSQLMSYHGALHSKQDTTASFDHSGNFVLSGDESSSFLFAWDVRTGELLQRLVGHSRYIRSIIPSAVESSFLSCGDDGRARLWTAPLDA